MTTERMRIIKESLEWASICNTNPTDGNLKMLWHFAKDLEQSDIEYIKKYLPMFTEIDLVNENAIRTVINIYENLIA